jgi:hypothetical protein
MIRWTTIQRRQPYRAALLRELRDALLHAEPAREVGGAPLVPLSAIRARLWQRGVAIEARQLGYVLRHLGIDTRRFRDGGARPRGVLLTDALRKQLTEYDAQLAHAPAPLRAAVERANASAEALA